MTVQATDYLSLNRGGTPTQGDSGEYKVETVDELLKLQPIIQQFGGQFLLDPNEINGMGVIGPYDNTNTQDLGNSGAVPNWTLGGFVYPFDVRLVQFYAWHRENTNDALPWGWRISRQKKVSGTTAGYVTTSILNQVADNGGTGPNNYPNTAPHLSDIDLSSSSVIPAGELVNVSVEAPTAIATNRYIQVSGAFMKFARV